MKPILFNTEMVKAILERRKTTTRRIAKWQRREEFINNNLSQCVADKYVNDAYSLHQKIGDCWNEITHPLKQPYKRGDVLYVRETWSILDGCYIYKADDSSPAGWYQISWHPSIHMPKDAARIFLRVTSVRIEQLKSITTIGMIEEGLPYDLISYYENQHIFDTYTAHLLAFADLWNSTVNRNDLDCYGWEANPWVWVINFELIGKEEAYADA